MQNGRDVMKKSLLALMSLLVLNTFTSAECRPVGGINHMKDLSHATRNGNLVKAKKSKKGKAVISDTAPKPKTK
jgi:hypothetical protein